MNFTLKLFRFIGLSVLWVLIYFSAAKLFFLYFWNFDFSSLNDWKYIVSQWQGGWVIDSLGELAFFVFVFTLIPAFLLGWFWVCHIKWGKVWQIPFAYFKEKARVKRRLALDAFPDPAVMAKELLAKNKAGNKLLSGKAPLHAKADLKSISAEAAKTPLSSNFSSELAEAPVTRIISDTPEPLPEPKYVSRIDVKYEVLQITEKYGVRLIQDLKIGKDLIDFAILVNAAVYLINLEPPGNEWIADETGFENDGPLWFSETKYEESPVYKLGQAARLFSSVLNDVMPPEHLPLDVKKVLLVGAGNILNYADIADTWNDKEVSAYRLSSGSPEEIPSFAAFVESISAVGAGSPEATEMIYTAFIAVEP